MNNIQKIKFWIKTISCQYNCDFKLIYSYSFFASKKSTSKFQKLCFLFYCFKVQLFKHNFTFQNSHRKFSLSKKKSL